MPCLDTLSNCFFYSIKPKNYSHASSLVRAVKNICEALKKNLKKKSLKSLAVPKMGPFPIFIHGFLSWTRLIPEPILNIEPNYTLS